MKDRWASYNSQILLFRHVQKHTLRFS